MIDLQQLVETTGKEARLQLARFIASLSENLGIVKHNIDASCCDRYREGRVVARKTWFTASNIYNP
jgi:hypothetical protein